MNSLRLKQEPQGLHRSASGPLYDSLAYCFMGLLSVRMSGSIILTPALKNLYVELRCSTLIWWFLLYLPIFSFAIFCCCLLEASSLK